MDAPARCRQGGGVAAGSLTLHMLSISLRLAWFSIGTALPVHSTMLPKEVQRHVQSVIAHHSHHHSRPHSPSLLLTYLDWRQCVLPLPCSCSRVLCTCGAIHPAPWQPKKYQTLCCEQVPLCMSGPMGSHGIPACTRVFSLWPVSYTHLTLPTTPYV